MQNNNCVQYVLLIVKITYLTNLPYKHLQTSVGIGVSSWYVHGKQLPKAKMLSNVAVGHGIILRSFPIFSYGYGQIKSSTVHARRKAPLFVEIRKSISGKGCTE